MAIKIRLRKIGCIENSEYELNDLTILCGINNSGKTYAANAIYGFLKYWHTDYVLLQDDNQLRELRTTGRTEINIENYYNKIDSILSHASNEYSKTLASIFGGNQKLFSNSKCEISLTHTIENNTTQKVNTSYRFDGVNNIRIKLLKSPDSQYLTVTINNDSNLEQNKIPSFIISDIISSTVKKYILKDLFPKPMIISTERTGSVMFQKELDFTRNRIVEFIGTKSYKVNPYTFLDQFKGNYPIPVRDSVDFTREMPERINEEGEIAKTHPEILDMFNDIIGGKVITYKNGTVYFVPNINKSIRLTLAESSSSVRSMYHLGCYIQYTSKKDELLVIDEPELNLHPENQRKIARLLASLVNVGVKILISTHSDYIVKELNTLIMLNSYPKNTEILDIIKKENYCKQELISSKQINVFINEFKSMKIKERKTKVKRAVLTPAHIDDDYGIDAPSFDDTISKMNNIQNQLMF